ncbi:MAG: Gldg family protein, partial [Nitrospinota bacterium]
GFYLSVGLFVSGLTSDQIVAFILATVVCFLFFMTGIPFITAQLDGWSGFFALGTKLQNFVGVTQHFEGLQRGVIDIKNLVYFIGMSILFLLLNSWFTDIRLRKGGKFKASVYGVVIFCAVVFLNVVASRIEGGRFDLTEDKLFTVSKAAKNVLSSLKAPVKIKFYITPAEKMPSEMKNLERDIRDKLEEFKLAAKGKLHFEIFNPTGEGALAEKIQKLDIQPIQVQSIDKDEIGVKLIYSALSISYLDKKEEVIPAVHPRNIQNLEYELISRVYKISAERKPKLAVYAPREVFPPEIVQFYLRTGRPIPEPKDLFSSINEIFSTENYTVETIDLTKESQIPEGTDTLLVLRPKDLNDRQRYELGEYLRKGGNLILGIQTFEYDYNPQGRNGTQVFGKKVNPNINPLLSNFGITVDDRILMDSNHEVLMIPTNQKFLGFNTVMNVPVKLPMQIAISAENMNKEVSISNRLSAFLYLWGTAITYDAEALKKNGITAKVLATSGSDSWRTDFKDGLLPLTALSPPPEGFEGKLPVAVLFEGAFPNLYEGKEIPEWPKPKEETDGDAKQESVPEKADEKAGAPGKMILVGSGKMFDDNLIGAAQNGMLLINSVDALSLG